MKHEFEKTQDTRYVLWTPEAAAYFLENLPGKHRETSQKHLTQLEVDLQNGADLSGTNIILNHEGEVLDGKMRLQAIINTNKPQFMNTTYQVEPHLPIDVKPRKIL